MTSSRATITARRRARFGAIALGLLAAGVAGYAGARAFTGAAQAPAAGLLALAAGAGLAAFFSPCSFPLLLTFLTRRADESPRAALASALRVGAGAALLLGVVAGAVATGAGALATVVAFDSPGGRFLRLGVGLLLIALGLRQAGVVRFAIPRLDSVARLARRPATEGARSVVGGDFAYGFGYLVAGFG